MPALLAAPAATTPTTAPVVPNINPDGSLPGGEVIGHVLNGLASWSLYACLFAFLFGAAIWAFSVRAGNFTQAHKGRDLLLGGLIGALVMVHGDRKGMRLPPRIAPIQVIIVPIWRSEEERAAVETLVNRVQEQLSTAGIRVQADWRDQVRPGFKFNDWELKGVPLRLEIGPRDAAADQVVAVRRDVQGKETVPLVGLTERVRETLEAVQTSLFE